MTGSWSKAQTAAQNYAGYLTGAELKNGFANTLTGFGNQIQAIIDKWNGVKVAADKAYAAQTRTATVGGNTNAETTQITDDTPTPAPTPAPTPTPKKKDPKPTRPASPTRPSFKKDDDRNTGLNIGSKTYSTSEFNSLQVEGKDGIYFPYTAWGNKGRYVKKGEGCTVTREGSKYKIDFHSWKPLYTKHAKGTTGTTRDEWTITDEPQFGDELTMYATPEGTLSFMRAGSTVIPADLTRELIDLPNVVDGLINRPNFDSGVNMISTAINKPEITIDVENFLKVDRVDKDTLPQLEAMMDKKIDTFAKQLNYSIKKFSR